jgi:hypothetical protein
VDGATGARPDRAGPLAAVRLLRTGLAVAGGPEGPFTQVEDSPVVDVRYLDVLALPGGGYRIWYEARLPDERHELRTERVGA